MQRENRIHPNISVMTRNEMNEIQAIKAHIVGLDRKMKPSYMLFKRNMLKTKDSYCM